MRSKHACGFILLDVILGMLISSIVALIALSLLATALYFLEHVSGASDAYTRGLRLLYLVESRVKNAGLGIPKDRLVKKIFEHGGRSALEGWESVVEILNGSNQLVGFTADESGEKEIARGTRLRVLSTNVIPNVFVMSTSIEWGGNQEHKFHVKKPIAKELYEASKDPLDLRAWRTMPSLGHPFLLKNLSVPIGVESGTFDALNMYVSMDVGGVDLLHSFRLAYFFAEPANKIFYIRDSQIRDTSWNSPAQYPVENGISHVCFELNKTDKILTMWLLVENKPQNNSASQYPSWAGATPEQIKNSRLLKASWHLKNY